MYKPEKDLSKSQYLQKIQDKKIIKSVLYIKE